jgi:Asp-tRNA(Asn)/Glu-tRNA(Gln) amidotransferase A subunit family amidase
MINSSCSLNTFTDWLRASLESRADEVQRCLRTIAKLDPKIHAWVEVNPQAAPAKGSLAGIPFGVKDIVEAKGLATEYGSPLYKGRVGTKDASIIRDLRRRGAILLGKTVTTAFACRTPGPTRNPHNLRHTPGGSSSGSAAAVAAGMVPFAIGQQTRGSIIRPASYCGVTGFKPTFGVLPMQGVLRLSKSLDTLGYFTHTPADMLALWKALGNEIGKLEKFVFGVPDTLAGCESEMVYAFSETISLLRKSGLQIKEVAIGKLLEQLDEANNIIMFYEGARVYEAHLKEFGERFDPSVSQIVRDGIKIRAAEYRRIRRFIAQARAVISKLFCATPVILTPAATGPAPLGLESTGDPRMNSPWTVLGTPAITLPMPSGRSLPLGLQLTADLNNDARALQAAVQLYERLHMDPKKRA